jgi:lambda family phage tail tape measure protein|tara:strand:+ start:482 stop:2560 length:2079 start_codon:yes stop_codon:yes gene_type:complete
MAKLNIDIVARDKTKQALGRVRSSLSNLKKSIFSVQSAFIGLGAGLVVKNLVSTGRELENLRVRLKFLLKDTNEGAKAFDNMVKFASKVPFSLEEIQSGSGILATVTDNADDLQKMLEITGNVAATTGLDFRTAAEQIQRSFSAGIGAADLFREKGVRNMLGFKAGATVSIEETVAAFERVFGKGGRFGNSTDELAKTFEGTLSMIGDKIFNFKKVLLEAGFFDELKKQFGDLDKFLSDNAEQLDKIAISVGRNLARAIKGAVDIGKDLLPLLQNIGRTLKSIVDGFLSLPAFVQSVGVVGALLFGKKGALAIAGVSFLIDKINDLIDRTNQAQFEELINIKSVEEADAKITQLRESIKSLDTDLMNIEQVGTVFDTRDQIAALEEEIELLNLMKGIIERNGDLEAFILHQMQKKNGTQAKFVDQQEASMKLLEKQIIAEREKKDLVEKQEKASEAIFEHQHKLHQGFAELPQSIEGIGGALDGFSEGLKSELDVTAFDRFKQAGQSALQSLKSSISDFVMTGKMNFAQLKEAIIRSLVDALVGQAVSAALRKATSMFKFEAIREGLIAVYKAAVKAFASFGGFPFGLVAASATIGAGMKLVDKIKGFESGGAVSKGQPIMVGERGAELFVPNQTGQITQSARGTVGGAVNVNFNITTVDARGFDQLLVSRRGTISRIINESVNERGREAII